MTELAGRLDVYESAAIADCALCYRESLIPCGNCGCPGCYDCTPDADEPCECLIEADEKGAQP